jgi:hypothetical protein
MRVVVIGLENDTHIDIIKRTRISKPIGYASSVSNVSKYKTKEIVNLDENHDGRVDLPRNKPKVAVM